MSTVKTKKVQLGTDATASNNFTLYQPATPDGTLRIGVGNADSPTEVGRFNSNGYVATNAPAFSAYASANQTLTSSVWTKVAIDTERYDTDSCFDTSTYRFTPNVEGYYQVNIVVRFTGATFTFRAGGIYKNSGKYSALSVDRETINAPVVLSGSDLIYMNGTTDYLECFAISAVSSGTPILDYSGTTDTSYFSAYLARAA